MSYENIPPWLVSVMMIAVVVTVAQILGWLSKRLGQPKVLGELITGLVLGASALNVLHPEDPIIAAVGEAGLLVLLFDIGLHTDVRTLVRVGRTALVVGAVGVLLPLVLGIGCATLFGLAWPQALLCGATLTATSIGISARVLQDIGRLDSDEGRIVLGAAVLDDVAGLVLLGIVGMVAGTGNGGHSSIMSLAMLGAFAIGLLLHRTHAQRPAQQIAGAAGIIVIPVFFAVVGAAVQLRAITGTWTVALFCTLLVAGIAGKFAAGFAPRGFTGNRMIIGLAMIPRGEVGLVFATTAWTSGLFNETLFSVMTLIVMVTTFLTPPLLTYVAKQGASG